MHAHNFDGLRVLALESRRAREIEKLIANYGGEPMVVPSVREISPASDAPALEFVRRLGEEQIDIVIFTTGAGLRALSKAIEGTCSRERLATLLVRVMLIARGPKPVVALRELGLEASLVVPEPNTWRDLLTLLDENEASLPLLGKRVAVQEYGIPNPELIAGLEQRGAQVFSVFVYEWALPEDTTALETAIESIVRGQIDVLLIASGVQIRHLFQVAERLHCPHALQDALSRVVIVSIGPLASEELRRYGLSVDIECSHPKMGFLVKEAAGKSGELLLQKRASTACSADTQ